ncbi:MAG: glycosyl transferase [Rhodospirillaceae bacterium]|nr:glycosyl transferase [Rhodospirillaceae bacterium]
MSTEFADYLKIIARGPTLSRSLTREEAEIAMGMVLDGKVDPEQLGGFLLVLRQRGETADEFAGFVDATKQRMTLPTSFSKPDIDWPTYADRHRQQPWYVLAALLLAENGISVFMHGIEGEHKDCAPTRPVLRALGIELCSGLDDAAERLTKSGFAYAGLETFAPETETLFHLKPKLGVRSVANTFVRDLNPFGAQLAMVGIVHSAYRPQHQETLRLLGQSRAAVFKGIGGEVHRNPYKAGRAAILLNGEPGEESWPALVSGEAFLWRQESLAPDLVAGVWQGETEHPPAVASITATAAIALRLLGRANDIAEADALAGAMWQTHLKTVSQTALAG